MCGKRGAEEEEEADDEIQNQKQEPHTKMCGASANSRENS